MKESLYSQWKPVERYTFNSEQDTRKQGTVVGTPTFSNWAMTINNVVWDYVNSGYDFSWKTKFTVRIKWTLTTSSRAFSVSQWVTNSATQVFLWMYNDNRCYFQTWAWYWSIALWLWAYDMYFVYDGSQATNATKAILYINWVKQTLGFTWTILTSCPVISSKNARIGNAYNGLWSYIANTWIFEIVEFFPKTFTDQEIANLYNNSTYKDIRNWLVFDIDSRSWIITWNP